MNVQVLGLGSAGSAAAQLAQAQGHQVIIQDEQSSPTLVERQHHLQAQGIQVQLNTPLHLLPDSDQVVVSPGIRWDHPTLNDARSHQIKVIGEAELAWQSLHHIPWVGITGTNGKTTTTALVAAMFQAAGQQAPACGNIGLPLCQVALDVIQHRLQPDWIIAELSSYQLEASTTLGLPLTPTLSHIGLWTTLTPDHLERHVTVESYAAIKHRLLDRMPQRIINGDDPYLYNLRHDWPNTLWTSCTQPMAPIRLVEDTIVIHGRPFVPIGDIQQRLPGRHNLHNLLMAVAAAHSAQLDPEAVAQAIATFPGVPHRLETVRVLSGIRFINDSKATNYDAAIVGLSSVAAPVILIAGGQPKQGDDQVWLDIVQQKAAQVLLIGEAAAQFANRFQSVHYTNYQIVHTLDQAVSIAYDLARSLQQALQQATLRHDSTASVSVLLSPACASFDQYPNFECRGDHFRTCCQQLLA